MRIAFVTLGIAAVLAVVASVAHAKWVDLPFPDPEDFVKTIDNPLFPLDPGTTFYYEGEEDGEPMSDEVYVTHKKIKILGVTCVVVRDQVFDADGYLAEDTLDYYAQDVDGNVWYMGEDTAELDHDGNVLSTEGTWRAGVDGAEAGIIMEADPKKADSYRQEYLEGEAEDEAKVVSLDEALCTDYDCYEHLLAIKEWSPLEVGIAEVKYYKEGIGFVYSEVTHGGDETLQLVSVTHE